MGYLRLSVHNQDLVVETPLLGLLPQEDVVLVLGRLEDGHLVVLEPEVFEEGNRFEPFARQLSSALVGLHLHTIYFPPLLPQSTVAERKNWLGLQEGRRTPWVPEFLITGSFLLEYLGHKIITNLF